MAKNTLDSVAKKIINRQDLDDKDGLNITKEVHKRAVAQSKDKKPAVKKTAKKKKK